MGTRRKEGGGGYCDPRRTLTSAAPPAPAWARGGAVPAEAPFGEPNTSRESQPRPRASFSHLEAEAVLGVFLSLKLLFSSFFHFPILSALRTRASRPTLELRRRRLLGSPLAQSGLSSPPHACLSRGKAGKRLWGTGGHRSVAREQGEHLADLGPACGRTHRPSAQPRTRAFPRTPRSPRLPHGGRETPHNRDAGAPPEASRWRPRPGWAQSVPERPLSCARRPRPPPGGERRADTSMGDGRHAAVCQPSHSGKHARVGGARQGTWRGHPRLYLSQPARAGRPRRGLPAVLRRRDLAGAGPAVIGPGAEPPV